MGHGAILTCDAGDFASYAAALDSLGLPGCTCHVYPDEIYPGIISMPLSPASDASPEQRSAAGAAVESGLTFIDGWEPDLIGLFRPLEVVFLEWKLKKIGLALEDLGVPLVAIDARTAAAIAPSGAKVAAVATTPTPEGFADAVRAVYPGRA